MNGTTDEGRNVVTLDIQELIMICLRKWWVIALFLMVGAAMALGITYKFVTPMYQADISIYVNNSRGRTDSEYLSSADLSAALKLVDTYISIAKSDRVLERVAEDLNGEYTVPQLEAAIRAERLNETEIFCVYVLHADPVEATRIANSVAKVAPVTISEMIDGTSARVIDTAKVPTNRHSPSYSRMTTLGGVIGVLMALFLLTFQYLQDTRIKDEEDLTSLFDYPVLGRIPHFNRADSGNSYGYGSTEEKKETAET